MILQYLVLLTTLCVLQGEAFKVLRKSVMRNVNKVAVSINPSPPSAKVEEPPTGEDRINDDGRENIRSNKESPKWLHDVNSGVVAFLKQMLNSHFEVADAPSGTNALEAIDRKYAKFAALETIARVPYFSYTSVLHLYETIGNFRNKEYIKLHFDESWNEMHHLLIMEELGGASLYQDRVFAAHMAFFYYWVVVALYMISPAAAYNFNSVVEHHAYKTYDTFLKENEQYLKSQRVPLVAKEYYGDNDSTSIYGTKKPLKSLYDVFVRIRDDELEHATTMEMLERKASSMFE